MLYPVIVGWNYVKNLNFVAVTVMLQMPEKKNQIKCEILLSKPLRRSSTKIYIF